MEPYETMACFMGQALDSEELRRRRRERITVIVLVCLLTVFTAVEIHLLKLSSRLPFVNSIFFFGLMNLNIVLIMVLLFLIFRNAVKIILDERGEGRRSSLKTRLVFAFLLFAIIPTLLLFTVSAFYIKSSFDKWFSVKVGGSLQRSIEVVKNYYESSEKSAAHFARKLAFALEAIPKTPQALTQKLTEARLEYRLDGVEYYADPFSPRILSAHPDREEVIPAASLETLQRLFAGNNECRVQNVGFGELVRCGAFLGAGKGVILTSYFIPFTLASNLSEITLTYQDFKSDNPLNYPIKSTYFAILSMVTLLILFCAIWTGFYLAKRLTGPIDSLLKATEEVARGNLDQAIVASGGYELSRLIHSFNSMTKELRENRRDIEEKTSNLERMNAELSHRRRYIEVLLESVQSGVVSLDEHGRISMVNQAASKLLRLPAENLVGKPYWAIIPQEHRTEFRELLIAVFGTAKPVRRELRIRTTNGEWVTVLVTISALRDAAKKQMGTVAVFDDVTDIQKMERMLAWREVAKRIAHEIKNPLTPIQLSVQRLRRRYLDRIQDDGAFGEATEIILKEVDALKALVSEFSSFARLPEIRPVPDSLNEIVKEATHLFRAAHEGIVFELNLCPDLPPMALDRPTLKRALTNLFDNAVTAMDGRGRITVTTRRNPDLEAVQLIIADEGCGIDEEAYGQVFEPYFSTKAGGTGLGLAIVHRIVADHGGVIRAASNEPCGTRFTIEFPETIAVTHYRGAVPGSISEIRV